VSIRKGIAFIGVERLINRLDLLAAKEVMRAKEFTG